LRAHLHYLPSLLQIIQFVRVQTTRAMGLIFLFRGALNQRANIQVQLGQLFE
jgi:hypothetical protein